MVQATQVYGLTETPNSETKFHYLMMPTFLVPWFDEIQLFRNKRWQNNNDNYMIIVIRLKLSVKFNYCA